MFAFFQDITLNVLNKKLPTKEKSAQSIRAAGLVLAVVCAFGLALNELFIYPLLFSGLLLWIGPSLYLELVKNIDMNLGLIKNTDIAAHPLRNEDDNDEQTVDEIIESLRKINKQLDGDVAFYFNLYIVVLDNIQIFIPKFRQKLYSDDYGNLQLDASMREMDYFLKEGIKRKLTLCKLPPHFDPENIEHYNNLVKDFGEPYNEDDPIDSNYEEIQRLLFSFLSASNEKQFLLALSELSISLMLKVFVLTKDPDSKTLEFYLGANSKDLIIEIITFIDKDKFPTKCVGNFLKYTFGSKRIIALKKWFLGQLEDYVSLEKIETGAQFEKLCAKQLRASGWNIKETPSTGDYGADLIAAKDQRTVAIQCKFYSKPIGVKAIQEAYSAKQFYNTKEAAVVCKEGFTKAARQMAQKNEVRLLTFAQLTYL